MRKKLTITEHDVRGKGQPIYKYTYRDEATNDPLDDGTHIVYVNNKYRDNSALGRLMQDFSENDPDKMHYEVLAKTTRYFKETEKGVAEMCRVMDTIYNEGYSDGCAQGAFRMITSMKNLMRKMNITEDEAREMLDISPEQYADYKKLAETVSGDAEN